MATMQIVYATCPACQEPLRIPEAWTRVPPASRRCHWRCKHCGQVVRPAGTAGVNPAARDYPRCRSRTALKTVLLLLLAFNIALGAYIGWREWSASSTTGVTPVPLNVTFRLLPVDGLTIKAGETKVIEVGVERKGLNETVQIKLEGLPEKVTAKPVTLASDQKTAKLEVVAAPDAKPGKVEPRLLASAGVLATDDSFPLTVVPPPRALRLLPVSQVTVKAGETKMIDIAIEREGFKEPVQVSVEGLPENVSAKPLTVAADQTSAKLELLVSLDARQVEQKIRIKASAGDLSTEQQVPVSIKAAPVAIGLMAIPPVTIKPGETKVIQIRLVRQGVKEPIEVTVEGLPAKVKAAPVVVASDATTAKLELVAAPDAREIDKEVRILAMAGDLRTENRIKFSVKRISSTDVPPPAVAAVYPRRALLVGVKNYLYASSINPGYRGEDPLGLKGLREALVKDMGFKSDQVAELSDTANPPHPPLKATIQDTIASFLQTSRPQDRVLLVFIGHAVEIEEKGYLVPIEGDVQQADSLIPLEWLTEQLTKCPARQKLLVLDVAHLDPERGMARTGGGALGAKIVEYLEKQPEGLQVWLSCSAGQQSHDFASSSFSGSVFMHFLVQICNELRRPEERMQLEERLGIKESPEAPLPLVLLATEVNRETTKYVKERWKSEQVPKLFGGEKPGPDPMPNDPPPTAVAIKVPGGMDTLAEPKLIAGIVKELELVDDGSGEISMENLPPFWAKNLKGYEDGALPDFADEKQLKALSAQFLPLRRATIDAAIVLQRHNRSFQEGFVYPGDDVKFKQMLLRFQEELPIIEFEMREALTKLVEAGAMREQETSKRWRAHYDYVHARLLAKVAWMREYNFVLGQMRVKIAGGPGNKENNGYVVIPQEKPQNKESREFEKQRQEVLKRLVEENPGTPWEIVARRERGAYLGLAHQEAKVVGNTNQPMRRRKQ